MSVDPALALLFALARDPTRPEAASEESSRDRIKRVKYGSEGGELKDGKQQQQTQQQLQQRTTRRRGADSSVPLRQSERAETRRKPRKRKTMKRCTSPSHFAIDPEEEIKYGADYTLDLPSRERVDLLLRSVAAFYYRPKEAHPNGSSVWVDSEYDQTQYPSLDLLLSPIRKVSARENWSNKEIAIFEAAVCQLGKNFAQIAKLIKTKTTSEVVNFYYTFWKHRQHYRIWKGERQQHGTGAAAVAGADISVGAAADAGAHRDAESGQTVPASAGSTIGASASAAASHPLIPAPLHSRRDDLRTPRIRVVDPDTGTESFFILPLLGDETHTKLLRREGAAAGTEGTEGASASSTHAAAQGAKRKAEEGETDDKAAASAPSAPSARGGSSSSGGSSAPAATAAAASSSSRSKAPSSSSSSSGASAPVRGYRCMFPATGTVAGGGAGTGRERLCHKFFTTTNALGSHLFMSHKIQKATVNGLEKGYFVECIK